MKDYDNPLVTERIRKRTEAIQADWQRRFRLPRWPLRLRERIAEAWKVLRSGKVLLPCVVLSEDEAAPLGVRTTTSYVELYTWACVGAATTYFHGDLFKALSWLNDKYVLGGEPKERIIQGEGHEVLKLLNQMLRCRP